MNKLNNWELSLGTYPGFLIGIRSYAESHKTNHVLYMPFIDVCLTVYKK